jgi:hypothetical protein
MSSATVTWQTCAGTGETPTHHVRNRMLRAVGRDGGAAVTATTTARLAAENRTSYTVRPVPP